MDSETKRLVEDAVEEFNRYHGVEAAVRVVDWLENGFTAEFRGSFCLTCGFYDYFDDLLQLLESRGIKAAISSITEQSDGALVEYRLGPAGEQRKRPADKVVLIFEWKRENGGYPPSNPEKIL